MHTHHQHEIKHPHGKADAFPELQHQVESGRVEVSCVLTCGAVDSAVWPPARSRPRQHRSCMLALVMNTIATKVMGADGKVTEKEGDHILQRAPQH
jgi:hypothetical protein